MTVRTGKSTRAVGPLGWVVALAGPVVVSSGLLVFRDSRFDANAALVLVLPVLVAALVGGRRGGVTAAIVAAGSFDFFFTRPYDSFTMNHHDDVETTIVLLVVGLVVGELVNRARESRRLAFASRREVEQIRRVAELSAGRGPTARLVRIVEQEVVAIVGARGARFERPPFPTSLPQLGHGVVTIGGDGRHGDAPPRGPSNEVELPVWGRGREIARLVLVMPEDSVGLTIPAPDRAIAVALADQLGAVLGAGPGE